MRSDASQLPRSASTARVTARTTRRSDDGDAVDAGAFSIAAALPRADLRHQRRLLMESPLWTQGRGQITRIEVGPLRGEALRDAIVSETGSDPIPALGPALKPFAQNAVPNAASTPPRTGAIASA